MRCHSGLVVDPKGRTRVVRHPANAGYGRSLKDGILAAKHDLIAITDADGTYPIDRIPGLAAKVEAGFDMAVGARQGEAYRESALKHPLRLMRDSLRTLQFIVQAILFHNPLKLFLCAALGAAAFGLLSAVAAAIAGGWVLWAFSLLGFAVAAFSCLIGLLAEMMRQIWRHAGFRGGPR